MTFVFENLSQANRKVSRKHVCFKKRNISPESSITNIKWKFRKSISKSFTDTFQLEYSFPITFFRHKYTPVFEHESAIYTSQQSSPVNFRVFTPKTDIVHAPVIYA